MLIRSSAIGIDEIFCSLQGYVGARVLNALRGTSVLDPPNSALCLGGVALTEKFFYSLTSRFVPGPTAFLGPIPIGTKNAVSYGLATYTTFKAMQVFGLILSVPSLVRLVGLASAVALGAGCVKHLLTQEPLENQLRKHAVSQVFANRVFRFEHEGKSYDVRIICNPEKKKVIFQPGGLGAVSSTDPYLVACNEDLSNAVINQIHGIFPQKSIFSAKINGILPIDYTASPQIS